MPTLSSAMALWFVIQEIVKEALHLRISEKLQCGLCEGPESEVSGAANRCKHLQQLAGFLSSDVV